MQSVTAYPSFDLLTTEFILYNAACSFIFLVMLSYFYLRKCNECLHTSLNILLNVILNNLMVLFPYMVMLKI